MEVYRKVHLKWEVTLIEVTCPEKIVKERISKQQGTLRKFGVYKDIKKVWEKIEKEHTKIDTSKNIGPQIEEFIKIVKTK